MSENIVPQLRAAREIDNVIGLLTHIGWCKSMEVQTDQNGYATAFCIGGALEHANTKYIRQGMLNEWFHGQGYEGGFVGFNDTFETSYNDVIFKLREFQRDVAEGRVALS